MLLTKIKQNKKGLYIYTFINSAGKKQIVKRATPMNVIDIKLSHNVDEDLVGFPKIIGDKVDYTLNTDHDSK